MSGGSAPSLFGYYPHALPHSRVSHSDPSYPPSSSYLNSNNYSGSVSTGSGINSTTTSSYANASTSHVQVEHPVGATGPSAPNDPIASGGDSLAGSSKRPFPFPLGSQERDKRARSCEGHNASGSGIVRNGSGMWEGPGGTWSEEQAVPEGRGGGGNGSRGDATIVGEDVRADEEADVDSSIGEAQIDEDEAPNQETSSYASAAESPQPIQFSPGSPVVIETPRLSNTIPFSAASTYARTSPYGAGAFPIDATSSSYPMEPMASATHNRGASPAPRIPTPAALRSSSPLDLPILSTSGSTSTSRSNVPASPNVHAPQPTSFPGARDTHPVARLPPLRSPSSPGLDRLPPLSMHALTGQEIDSPGEPESATRPRPGLFDMRWMTRQYGQMPESRGSGSVAPTTLEIGTSRPQELQAEHPRASHSRSDSGNVERSGRALRALPVTRRVRSPPPTLGSTLGSTRDLTVDTAVNFGSSSVDSALPTSAFGERRMPLPQVDLEQDWMVGSASSGFAGATSSRAIGSASPVPGSDGAELPFRSALSPGLDESLSPIVNGPASPSFGGLASPMGIESVASTVQSDDEPNSISGAGGDNVVLPNERLGVHTEITVAGGHSASATFGSPSTSGSSASTRTTPSGYTRRPPSLSLRGFPTSPTFSSMSGPVSASPSFMLPESPTFPVSASPRTSTFDLAVTPPGSALPSFVARMMEVDSPVREGADSLGHAYTIPELVLEPRAENDAASIDALRRFARGAGGTSPNEATVGSYFAESPDPEIRREPIRFPLGVFESLGTEDLSARALREFDQSNRVAEQAPLFPLPRGESEVAQQGSSTFSQPGSSVFVQQSSSTFSTGTDSTAHQLDESGPVWSSRSPGLGSTHSQRLTESGVSYPSRPSASDTSFPSFRANVSPGPELNMGSRPGRLVRDMSWSFSDVFRPGHEGSIEALSGSGSETNLRSYEHDERIEGDNRGTRAGVRNALTRAARLAAPARGNESLPRLHLNALPRVSGVESSTTQDEQSQSWNAMTASTNLSRTPPSAGPSESDVPSFAEAWLEEGSRSTRPLPPRRMSGPRWMDLFSETSNTQPVAVPTAQRPSNRPRMPPAIPTSSADSTLFDPLSGMNWPSDAHPPQAPLVPQAPRAETRQEPAQDSLARYQTFAQSIDELRRSPAHLQQAPNASPNPWSSNNGGTGLRLPPVIAPSTTTAFPPARPESTGLSGISTWFGDGGGNNSRPPWAMPRHEPLPMLDEPRRPYGHDTRQPPAPPPELARGPPSQPQERGANWLREWERERDRQSRLAREDYWRRRETESVGVAAASAGPSGVERRRATSVHRPLAQLSGTQAQGRMWDEYNTRHEPRPWPTMTRSSLVATGFADDDLSNEWPHDGNAIDLWGSMPRRPPRRQEVLPPRLDGAGAPTQSSEATANRISDLPFTESPPSLLQELIDMSRVDHYNDSFSSDVFQSFQRANSQQAVPGSNPPDFRHAGDALRRSLANTPRRTSRERDNPNRPGQPRSPPSRRFLGLGETPVQSQPGSSANQTERSRLSFPRDRWDMLQLARSQTQLDRMRQLLHPRSGDSRERDPSRRRLTDLGRSSATQTSRRRSFMSALETEPVSPTSLEPARGAQWPRDPETQPSVRHDDRSSWSSTESPRNNLQELLRAASRVRRRRTLLPESASRRAPSGFLNSVDHALHQVESGLLHINRELSALADESGRFNRQTEPAPQPRPITHDHNHEDISPTSRMDWTYDQSPDRVERSSPPPRLPPFEFSQLQRNVDWPSSRRNTLERRYEEEDEMPVRSLSSYLEHRQAQRDALPRPVRPPYTYEHSWRDSVGTEPRSNDVTPSSVATSMPMRDRLLFRASAPNRDPPNNSGRSRILRHPDSRDNSGNSSTQPAQPSTPFRLHRRRPPSPVTSDDPPPAPVSLSPPRSYASRFSHLLPRRSSGRGPPPSGANSDDNDEWIHPSSSGRMFFLRPRARARTTSGGDFLRDDEFDDSYEGLLRLAARIGDAKPRGTPADVIKAMPTGSYANCPGAKAETRCPICLDDYEQEDIVALIRGCSHWFHKECIQQWLGLIPGLAPSVEDRLMAREAPNPRLDPPGCEL
ncbi:hypothetical protein FRC06_005327 [Ceratobasidium sp. 370]|nr:hypothetical protein FRC06_005327 [Ceratobasidium sp. 370]